MEEKGALLVIDMLNDFVLEGAPLEVASSRSIIPAIRRRIEEARSKDIPIVYVCDAHQVDDEEFNLWPRHAVKGTEGAKVISELAPLPGDIVVEKTRYSGFFGTDLEELLHKLKVKRITIVGILTNICVLFTAADAVMRGFTVEIPRDSVAAATKEEHEFALEQMARVFGVRII